MAVVLDGADTCLQHVGLQLFEQCFLAVCGFYNTTSFFVVSTTVVIDQFYVVSEVPPIVISAGDAGPDRGVVHWLSNHI